MKLGIFGATGPTGQQLVKEALARGHQTVALVRSPDKIKIQHDNLQVSKVDIYKPEELVPHLEGCDAVLSALGYQGWLVLSGVTLYEDTITSITAAMRQAKVSRFVGITSWCTESAPGNPKLMEWIVRPFLIGNTLKSMARMEQYLVNECTDINYTVVRPPQLIDQSTEEKELLSQEGQSIPGLPVLPKLSRGHLAKFMIDCLSHDKWDRKAGTPVKDVEIPENAPKILQLEKHADYIAAYGAKKDDYEYCMTEYLRMSGIYWGLTAIDLMGQLNRMNKEEVLEFVQQCQHECGGLGASLGHDPHLLYTLSAVQILVLYDSIDLINVDKLVEYVQALQQDDGSFTGDKWGEVDTRFSFCAVACLSLLGRLNAIKVDKAVEFVVSCMNFDGGFGCRPGSESHSGQIYCCVGMLAVTGHLHHVKTDMLGWWLCERQLPSGGLNGRPEKLPDVCYSWWVLASLKIIGRLHWIDKDKLVHFILACQDDETGGFADRPGDMVDPFHTLFGICGLSLMGDQTIKPVNPVFCMPEETIRRVGVQLDLL